MNNNCALVVTYERGRITFELPDFHLGVIG